MLAKARLGRLACARANQPYGRAHLGVFRPGRARALWVLDGRSEDPLDARESAGVRGGRRDRVAARLDDGRGVRTVATNTARRTGRHASKACLRALRAPGRMVAARCGKPRGGRTPGRRGRLPHPPQPPHGPARGPVELDGTRRWPRNKARAGRRRARVAGGDGGGPTRSRAMDVSSKPDRRERGFRARVRRHVWFPKPRRTQCDRR